MLAASTALPAAAQVKFHPVLVHPHVSDGFPFIGVHTHTPGLQPLAQRAQVNAALIKALVAGRSQVDAQPFLGRGQLDQGLHFLAQQQLVERLLGRRRGIPSKVARKYRDQKERQRSGQPLSTDVHPPPFPT